MHRMKTASAGAKHAAEQPLPLTIVAARGFFPDERQDVEDEDGDRRPGGRAEPGTGLVEVGLAALVEHHQLPVEDGVARRQSLERLNWLGG